MNKVILIIIYLLSFGCEDKSIYEPVELNTSIGYTEDECFGIKGDCYWNDGEYTPTNTWQGSECMCVCQR